MEQNAEKTFKRSINTDFNLDEDILFKSDQSIREDNAIKIIDIPLDTISAFPHHPFKVREDKDMMELSDSYSNPVFTAEGTM